jgi:hypothetical protein
MFAATGRRAAGTLAASGRRADAVQAQRIATTGIAVMRACAVDGGMRRTVQILGIQIRRSGAADPGKAQ